MTEIYLYVICMQLNILIQKKNWKLMGKMIVIINTSWCFIFIYSSFYLFINSRNIVEHLFPVL